MAEFPEHKKKERKKKKELKFLLQLKRLNALSRLKHLFAYQVDFLTQSWSKLRNALVRITGMSPIKSITQ